MFAWRLRASRLPLFYGKNGCFPAISKNLLNRERTYISSQSTSTFFGGGIGSFRRRGMKLHSCAQDDFSELDEHKEEEGAEGLQHQQDSSSALEDDDWSELGPVKKDSIVIPKLLTEKPELFREAKGKRITSLLSSSAVTKSTNSKGLTSKPSKPSPATGHKLKAKGNVSRTNSEKKNETATKNSNSTTVADVPSSVLSIRISNLSLETADSAVHSTCTSFGSLEGLVRVDQDTVEALFRVRDSKEAELILEKLNETTVDGLRWAAEVQHTKPTRTDVEASRDQMGPRIISCTEDLKRQMTMCMILIDDLENLLQSVLHLKNHPMSRKD